jgi:ABC transporter substrate binding protein
VFAVAADPVSTGLVASLARPGGNVTGLSSQASDLAGKRLALLQEVVPGLGRLAILTNVGSPNALLEMREVQATTSTLGLEVATLEIRRAEDIAPAFEAIKGQAQALYVNACDGGRLGRQQCARDCVLRVATALLGVDLPVRLDQHEDRIIAVRGKRAGGGSYYCRKEAVARSARPWPQPWVQRPPSRFRLKLQPGPAGLLGLSGTELRILVARGHRWR